jgi:uncharacterized membrane protein YhaH (DUF805 family)
MNNNIYSYKTPKSGNEETGFFNIKGRIPRIAFLLRFALVTFLFFLSYYIKDHFEAIYYTHLEDNWEVTDESTITWHNLTSYFHDFITPVATFLFISIQGAKRMHDVNKSGWYFFIPLYNIYLAFSPGTKGNNNYGIDPSPVKNIQYFDELELNNEDIKAESTGTSEDENRENYYIENQKAVTSLKALNWRQHLNQIREQNPNKTYKEIVQIASNTYKSSKFTTETKDYLEESNKSRIRVNKLQLYASAFFLLIPIFLLTKPDFLFNIWVSELSIHKNLNFISLTLLYICTPIFSYLLINNFRKRNYFICIILGYNIIYVILLFVEIPFLNDINGGFKLKKIYINLSLILILFNLYAIRKSWKILRDPWNLE